MHSFHIRALATVAVAAFALAACGSSSKSSSSTDTTTTPSTAATATTTVAPDTSTAPAAGASASVAVATTPLGKILADDKGMTLYRFDNDTTAGKSSCTTAPCSTTWPAAKVTGTPVAGTGVTASKLSSFKLADGTSQLEMDGHPLYHFAGDAAAGDTLGQGIIGKWFVVSGDGTEITTKA